MMFRRTLPTLLISVFILINCSSSVDTYDGEVTIQGEVFDVFDGDTLFIKNQNIKIGDFDVSTDEKGHFKVSVPQDIYTVKINSENHQLYEETVEVSESLNINIELPQKMVWTFALKLGTVWIYNDGEFKEEVINVRSDGLDSIFTVERSIKQDSIYTTSFKREIRKDHANGHLIIKKVQFQNRLGYCGSIFDSIKSDLHDSREYRFYTHYPKSRLINNRIVEHSCCGGNSNNHITTILLSEKKGFECRRFGPNYDYVDSITETIIGSN